jgi:hypothetical protein
MPEIVLNIEQRGDEDPMPEVLPADTQADVKLVWTPEGVEYYRYDAPSRAWVRVAVLEAA